jgi:topoisomerase-4 subunit A
MGWVRAAKGHDIDAAGLTYKAGDELLAATRSRSNQSVIFFDSTGRSYTIAAHTLPSARGQGEPLTGRLSPPAGASFQALVAGDANQRLILASDAGYGFITRISDLTGRSRTGKAALTLPEGATVLPPQPIDQQADGHLAIATSAGRLLLVPIEQLPELSRGKGSKLIQIPAARATSREEIVVAIAYLPVGRALVITSGRRNLTLRNSDLERFIGDRARRGTMLSRGLQRVDRLEAGEG